MPLTGLRILALPASVSSACDVLIGKFVSIGVYSWVLFCMDWDSSGAVSGERKLVFALLLRISDLFRISSFGFSYTVLISSPPAALDPSLTSRGHWHRLTHALARVESAAQRLAGFQSRFILFAFGM
jgi:hypothetical protein